MGGTYIPYPAVPDVPGVPQLNRVVEELAFTQSILGGIEVDFSIQEELLADQQANQSILAISPPNNAWGIFGPLPNITNQLGINNNSNLTTKIPQSNAGQTAGVDVGGNFTFSVTGAETANVPSTAILSVLSVEFLRETRVSDFPVQNGGFATYNKYIQPGDPKVTLALEGSENDRVYFLNAIDAACQSTNLYSVVTPDQTFMGYTLERYNYMRKSSRGVTLLIVEIVFKEVRQVTPTLGVQSPINTPQNPSATPLVNGGNIQPAAPSPSVSNSANSQFPTVIGPPTY